MAPWRTRKVTLTLIEAILMDKRRLETENALLRQLLKAAAYHVESEGDVSLLTEIKRMLASEKKA
jgi:hypothetical protein